jgi:hypothetical protein
MANDKTFSPRERTMASLPGRRRLGNFSDDTTRTLKTQLMISPNGHALVKAPDWTVRAHYDATPFELGAKAFVLERVHKKLMREWSAILLTCIEATLTTVISDFNKFNFLSLTTYVAYCEISYGMPVRQTTRRFSYSYPSPLAM